MKKYNVYGMGAALVDTEIEVDDAFLGSAGIDKGVMTLVDEARQDRERLDQQAGRRLGLTTEPGESFLDAAAGGRQCLGGGAGVGDASARVGSGRIRHDQSS